MFSLKQKGFDHPQILIQTPVTDYLFQIQRHELYMDGQHVKQRKEGGLGLGRVGQGAEMHPDPREGGAKLAPSF